MQTMAQKRITKDYEDMLSHYKDIFSVQLHDPNKMNIWYVSFIGAKSTAYENEKFKLRIKFDDTFPLEAPEVIFVDGLVPAHPHIFSNGFICLSILYDAWAPSLKVSSICLSILSMLSSCKKKKKPEGDKDFVKSCAKGSSPKDIEWDFHDDKV